MRAFAILTFTLLTTLYASAQTLYDIYLMLPDKVALGDRVAREQMIKNYQTGNKKLGDKLYYRFDIVDEKNGFLNVTGGFEGIWEMCYWNLGKKKLIAVYHQGCGPVCYIKEFKFFTLQNGKIELLEIEDIIPGYKTLYEDFFIDYSDNRQKKLRDNDMLNTGVFNLGFVALKRNEASYRMLKWWNERLV